MPNRWRVQTNRVGPVEIDVVWRPATGEASGDFFDLIERRDGRLVVVLGDAPGHGQGAAAVGEELRSRLRRSFAQGASLLEAVADLGRKVRRARLTDLMASVVVVEVDASAHRFDLVNAGHPPPLQVSASSNVAFVDARPDALLGINDNRKQHTHRLASDSVLVLFSDGLVERTGGPLQAEGMDVLLKVARGLSHAAAAPSLARGVTEALGQPTDDATILSIRLGDAPPQPLEMARLHAVSANRQGRSELSS